MKNPRISKASGGVKSELPVPIKQESVSLVEEPKIMDRSSATINSKLVNDYIPAAGSPEKDSFKDMREENVIDDRNSSRRPSAISDLKSNKSRSVSEARQNLNQSYSKVRQMLDYQNKRIAHQYKEFTKS